MSTTDVRYPSATDVRYPAAPADDISAPPVITPQYASTLPSPPGDLGRARNTRCATGIRFITTIHGILNIVIIVALVCVIISAGVGDRENTKLADKWPYKSSAKVSAYNTRNAVLVFAIFGLFLILLDTILHMTALINRLPAQFDKAFIITMLVFAGIYLILGCCAAAWDKKMRDTVGTANNYKRKGCAASAAFFLFVAMIATIADFVLRLITRPIQSYNPSAIINRNADDARFDMDGASRF